jgi:hypothetical protein
MVRSRMLSIMSSPALRSPVAAIRYRRESYIRCSSALRSTFGFKRQRKVRRPHQFTRGETLTRNKAHRTPGETGAASTTIRLQSPDEVHAHFRFSKRLPKSRLMYVRVHVATLKASIGLLSWLCSWLSRESSLAQFRVDYPCLRRLLDNHGIGSPFFDMFLGLRAKDELLSEKGHGLWMASTGRGNNAALTTSRYHGRPPAP